jgi:hypothetical protein
MKVVGKTAVATLVLAVIGWPGDLPLLAQTTGGGGGDFGGATIQQPTTTQQPATTTPTQQTPQAGPSQQADFTTGGDFDFGNLIDQLTVPEIPQFENERFQPFVGRSLQRFELQGIRAHPRSNIEVPGSSGSGGGGGGRVAGGGRGQTTRGLQPGASNAIIRRSLRTRVVPQIVIRSPVSTQQVSSRFQQRITQSRLLEDPASGVQVRVEGKTAYLSGVVTSPVDRERIERMARLEPGIYRIDNQILVQP